MNKKILAIAILFALVVGVAFVYAQDRQVATILQDGTYVSIGSGISYAFDLTWSGRSGTFRYYDRNNSNNSINGTYRIENGKVFFHFGTNGRGEARDLNGLSSSFDIDNARAFSGNGLEYRLR